MEQRLGGLLNENGVHYVRKEARFTLFKTKKNLPLYNEPHSYSTAPSILCSNKFRILNCSSLHLFLSHYCNKIKGSKSNTAGYIPKESLYLGQVWLSIFQNVKKEGNNKLLLRLILKRIACQKQDILERLSN